MSIATIASMMSNFHEMKHTLKLCKFTQAIEMCSQCFKDANSLKNIKTVQDYSAKFSESYELIESAMESAINSSTQTFDEDVYLNALQGYISFVFVI
jgi:hypothetical protein